MASNAENVSIGWRHHETNECMSWWQIIQQHRNTIPSHNYHYGITHWGKWWLMSRRRVTIVPYILTPISGRFPRHSATPQMNFHTIPFSEMELIVIIQCYILIQKLYDWLVSAWRCHHLISSTNYAAGPSPKTQKTIFTNLQQHQNAFGEVS